MQCHPAGHRSAWTLALALAAACFPGCATYRPAPLDPTDILAGLRAVSLDDLRAPPPDAPVASTAFDPSDGLTPDEAAAVALQLNPALRARRAELGVAGAQAIEAGLLPDPTFGWELSEGAFEFLAPLLRPGERAARLDAADARTREVRWSILRDEWTLQRDVQLAFLEVLAARERRQLNERLSQVADHTQDFFLKAREARAVTALQETTASIQALEVRLERQRLVADERRARQALNALLGLPPDADWVLQEPADVFAADALAGEATVPSTVSSAVADALVDAAVHRRPDLAELLAAYDRAEQALRLAVAQQWPELSLGTTVELTLPLLGPPSRLGNRPAIQTAWEAREVLRHEVEAAVHGLRAEVHDAALALDTAREQLAFSRQQIVPRVDESLALAEAAFDARSVTAGEILIAQSQVLAARVRLLETRIEHARALAALRWVTGADHGAEP